MIISATLQPYHTAGGEPQGSVDASFDIEGRPWIIVTFRLGGFAEPIVLPETSQAHRTDELWRSTCVEVFAQLEDGRYAEFNVAPSGEWAAYSFSGYRQGMAELDGKVRLIRREVDGDTVVLEAILDWSDWPRVKRVGLSAVVQASNGAISYWALSHPAGKPDFHHPDSFALRVAPRDLA